MVTSPALGYYPSFSSRTPQITAVLTVQTKHRDRVDSTPVSYSGDARWFKSRHVDRPS
jgi:hypothetical protein